MTVPRPSIARDELIEFRTRCDEKIRANKDPYTAFVNSHVIDYLARNAIISVNEILRLQDELKEERDRSASWKQLNAMLKNDANADLVACAEMKVECYRYREALEEIAASTPASGGGWAGAEPSFIAIARKAMA